MTLSKEEIEMIDKEAAELYNRFNDVVSERYKIGYFHAATKYLLQLKAERERERAGKFYDIVQKLADWSKKYPRGPIYPMSQKKMDDELIQIEELAKTAINEYNKKP